MFERMMKSAKPNPDLFSGLVVALLTLLCLIIYRHILPSVNNFTQLLINETTIVLIAFLAMRFHRVSPRVVLPIRMPRFRQIAGIILLGSCTFYLSAMVNIVTMPLFSQMDIDAFNNQMKEMMTSSSLPVMLLMCALLPGICEEILFRGFIQYSCSGLKKRWMIPCVVGLLFGIVHFHLFRILPTAIIGIALSFIMLRSQNISLSMLGHFLNNATVILISYVGTTMYPKTTDFSDHTLSPDLYVFAIGLFLFFGSLLPLVLYGSNILLLGKDEKLPAPDVIKRHIFRCFFISVLLLALGSGVVAFSLKMAI